MFINRDYSRTEHDDWALNVCPKLHSCNESIEVYIDSVVVGWKIQWKFE